MIIKELINKLEKIENKNLLVCVELDDNYWGPVYHRIEEVIVSKTVQPDGPKSEITTAVILR